MPLHTLTIPGNPELIPRPGSFQKAKNSELYHIIPYNSFQSLNLYISNDLQFCLFIQQLIFQIHNADTLLDDKKKGNYTRGRIWHNIHIQKLPMVLSGYGLNSYVYFISIIKLSKQKIKWCWLDLQLCTLILAFLRKSGAKHFTLPRVNWDLFGQFRF